MEQSRKGHRHRFTVWHGSPARYLSVTLILPCHHTSDIADLHAAPGKQNGDAHSGQTGAVRFFEPGNMARTQRILCTIARLVDGLENIVGLELLNEPQNNPALGDWYRTTIDAIRQIPSDLPIYVGDAWDSWKFANFIKNRSDFVVLDTHIYRCFTPQDFALTGEEHAERFRSGSDFAKNLEAISHTCRGNLIVGEFSAALNPQSTRSSDPMEVDRQRRVFVRAELGLFEKPLCSGWFFWTYAKDQRDSGWSLKDAMTAYVLPTKVGGRRLNTDILAVDGVRFQEARTDALGHSPHS